MSKENSIHRTHEIKSNMLINLKTAIDRLYFHIKDDNVEQFRAIFVKSKINVDTINENGNSLLSFAVQCNCYDICEYLLNMGADVNSQNVTLFLIILEIYELAFTLRSFTQELQDR